MISTINDKVLPLIAIGTWSWGGGINGSKMIFGNTVEDSVLKESFRQAYGEGFRFWDTAPVYGMGKSEQILGECMEKNSDIILSTKYMPEKKFSEKKVRNLLSESMGRLPAHKPDIYWLHMPVCIEENLKVFASLQKEGKIASIGVSNCSLEQLNLAKEVLAKEGVKLAGVQNHYSLIYRGYEKTGVLDWCRQENIPFFAYMVLEQGALTGKFNAANPMPRFSRRGLAYPKRVLRKLEPLHNGMRELGNKYEVSVSGIAMAWAIGKGTIPLVGITKPYQAKELAKAASVMLTNDELCKLDEIAELTGVEIKGIWENKIKK